ncbi:MAG: prolipoprotein diacylglyceryl transferase [Gemmatimonadota bacterium]|nr:MAG: prolipoprotein diacylglyceryl transferase [Gemmatimonadota bacterium]
MIGETLFTIGPFKAGTFGFLVALGFIVPAFILEKDFPRKGLDGQLAFTTVLAAAVGGMLGGRIYYTIEHWDQVLEQPARMLLTGSGLVWYGGLLGGVLGAAGYCYLKRIPFLVVCDLFAPMLALGHVFGRLGCLLSGDGDYGPPTDVPWAMAFPRGAVPTTERVHPTPIYDMILLLAVLAFLWSFRKREYRPGFLFGFYLILSGIARFITEFYRLTPEVWLGLTTAQLFSIALVVTGIALTLLLRSPRKPLAVEAGAGSDGKAIRA